MTPLNVLSSADFNRDRSVDAADLALWRTGIGMAAGAGKHDGDANNDGAVDGGDFLLWQSQVGTTAPGAHELVSTVPEPATCGWWAGLPAMAALLRRRRPGLRHKT